MHGGTTQEESSIHHEPAPRQTQLEVVANEDSDEEIVYNRGWSARRVISTISEKIGLGPRYESQALVSDEEAQRSNWKKASQAMSSVKNYVYSSSETHLESQSTPSVNSERNNESEGLSRGFRVSTDGSKNVSQPSVDSFKICETIADDNV